MLFTIKAFVQVADILYVKMVQSRKLQFTPKDVSVLIDEV